MKIIIKKKNIKKVNVGSICIIKKKKTKQKQKKKIFLSWGSNLIFFSKKKIIIIRFAKFIHFLSRNNFTIHCTTFLFFFLNKKRNV
ncbi:hypothetical protein HANVADRAFT_65582 [Hanseniaspora valbyensis NRRL Y-1626]|uniref:Uncharacterized protein n=1 Tax=Hanseniaspora valbyensis NRRL Y-1626 TaxID=766949 RepID=A0A1B7TK69_9ASCO|nr:hypothetical protein HANVADRAFT_65582 [Hanseniaspora valbyensis NRRL Y-1626]